MDESKLIELLTKFKDEIKQDVNLKFKEMSNLLEEKFTQLKKSVEVHENKISFLEREWRSKNLIIYGLKELNTSSYFATESYVMNFIKDSVKVNIKEEELDLVRRIGKKDENKCRPILLRVTTFRKKILILKNKKQLKGQDIYISEDFSYETRAKRKELFEPMVEARKAGKIAYIRYDKLIIKEPSDKFIGSKRMLESSPKFQEVNKKENKRHKTEVKQLARSFSTRDISHFFRDGSDSDGSTSQSSKGNRGRKRED